MNANEAIHADITGAIVYPYVESDLEKIVRGCADLQVHDVDDTEGLAAVSTARKGLKSVRVQIEKRRLELNSEAQAHIRKVNSGAKVLTAMIVPTEQLLLGMEREVEDAKAAIKQAKLDAELLILNTRIAELSAVGAVMLSAVVQAMSDDEFREVLKNATIAFEEKCAEKAIAAEKREAARLLEVKELAEAQKALEIERAAVTEAAEEAQKALEIERAAASAAAKVERDRLAKDREQFEAKLKDEADKKAKAKEARLAAKRAPHIEQVRAYIEEIRAVEIPKGEFSDSIQTEANSFLDHIESILTNE